MKKISVIIAIYNGEKFIFQTLESILAQSYTNFEIIVVVNCSSDKTIEIVKSFNDERINIYETNICQLAFNLNYGLLKSSGEYIVRIDADDIALPERFEKQINIIEKFNCDIVGSNLLYIDELNQLIKTKQYQEFDDDIRKAIVYKNPIAHPSVMYRKSVVLKAGGYMNGKVSEDYDLWLRLMRDKSVKFYNIQENLTKYRIHSNQAKGDRLAYYEICGYMIREALYQKSFKYVIGFFVYLFKALLK